MPGKGTGRVWTDREWPEEMTDRNAMIPVSRSGIVCAIVCVPEAGTRAVCDSGGNGEYYDRCQRTHKANSRAPVAKHQVV